MNILFNCGEYPPMPSGGIGSVTKIVAEGLVKRGHNVVVAGYYYYQPACETYSVQNGVHIYNYSLGYHDSKLKSYLFYFLNKFHLAAKWTQRELDYYEGKLTLLIEEYDIDILEMTDFYNFNYCRSPLVYRQFKIPVVMRFHGSAYFLGANSGNVEPTIKNNDLAHFSRAKYYSYVSSYIRDYVRKMGAVCAPEREIIIHNMVEDDFLYEDISPADNRTILFIGKLTEAKGALSTIKAFCDFHKNHPWWKLVMAGSAYTDALLEGVSDETRKAVVFPGLCDRQQIKFFIDNSSFICVPSFFEAFGMTPIEGMARSKAVIFTERSSGPEIIEDGVNGLLVDPENISLIKEKMTLLADNEQIRDKISKNAYNTIETSFCERCILDKLENYYQSLT